MAWLAATVAVSTAISVAGAFNDKRAARRAAKKRKAAARLQVAEMERKSEFNLALAKEETESLQGFQVSQFAKAGVDVSSGAPLQVAEQTAYNLQRDSIEQRAEVYKSGILIKKGAALDARALTNQARANLTGTIAQAGLTAANFMAASGSSNKASKSHISGGGPQDV